MPNFGQLSNFVSLQSIFDNPYYHTLSYWLKNASKSAAMHSKFHLELLSHAFIALDLFPFQTIGQF